MIIPLPVRIPIFPAFLFACALVLIELLEKTDPLFSALVFCFVMLSVLAFNVAGGFSRTSGAYIFFYAVLAVIVGVTYKALLGEAAQTNLQQPLLLMSTYVASIVGLFVAAFLARKIATTQDGLSEVLNVHSLNLTESALGCFILYFVVRNAGAFIPGGGGQLLNTLNLLNPFLPLSMLLGTVAAVRTSRGQHSTSPLVWCAIGYSLFYGILAFSKQGAFTPPLCWLVGAAWARFRLRPKHVIMVIAYAIIGQTIIVPLSGVRDEVVTGSTEERIAILEHYLTHLSQLRAHVNDTTAQGNYDQAMYYYNRRQGIFDRITMMPNDSVLISFSDQGNYYGYKAYRYYFENWVPHIIDPHKLEGVQVGGNAYMHEMNMLADSDTTTGISFSPTAESFHIGGWPSLLLVAPLVWLLLFVTTDAVCGDLRRQPWGLTLLIGFAHVAPEGGLGEAIWLVWAGNIGVALAIFTCGYVTPLLGLLLSGRSTIHETSARPPLPRQLQVPARQA